MMIRWNTGWGVLVAAGLAFASPASADCTGWTAGPLESGHLNNGANGGVYALVSWDPDGPDGPEFPRLVAGGSFSMMQGVEVNRVASLHPVTGLWESMGAIDGWPLGASQIDALHVMGTTLFAGSATPDSNPYNARRWNGSSWGPMNSAPCVATLTPQAVTCFTTYNGQLVAGGFIGRSLTQPGGGCAFSGAQRGATTWLGPMASPWTDIAPGNPAGSGMIPPSVEALRQFGTRLFVGGWFHQDEETNPPGNFVAAFDSATGTWSALDGGMNDVVHALGIYNGEVIAAGRFTIAGGVSCNRIARWNGTSWQPLGGGMNGIVHALSNYGGKLIAGGQFTTAGGQTVNNIAAWNGSFWEPLTAAGGLTGTNGAVYALVEHEGKLIAGGGFTTAGGFQAKSIARWNGISWLGFGGGTVSSVDAMTTFGGRMIAAGNFIQSTPSGDTVRHLVTFNGTKLGTIGQADLPVYALRAHTNPGPFGGTIELVVGGSFTTIGGITASSIARRVESPVGFPLPQWHAMGPGFNGTVTAIERHSGETYAGGSFTTTGGGGTVLNRIARWNVASQVWQAMGSGMNGTVQAICTYGGMLYAGGSFTTAGGVATGGLARWDGSSWGMVGGTFSGTVFALVVHDNELVIGGNYPGISGSPNLAKFNAATGLYSTLGSGGANGTVRSLHSSGGLLYVGGGFSSIGGISASRAAVWNGSFFGELDGGAASVVLALATWNGEMHAGGNFLTVRSGTISSPGWGRYRITGAPWIALQPSNQNVLCGQLATFEVQPATGYEPLAYRWYRNGVQLVDGPSGTGSIIQDSATMRLFVFEASANDAASYHAEVVGQCGTVVSAPRTLSIIGGEENCPSCPGDLAPSFGIIDFSDLVMIFEAWGPCPDPGVLCPADLSGDGTVGLADLLMVLGGWGYCP